MQHCANGGAHFDPSSVGKCLRETGEAEISWAEFLQLLEVEEGSEEETLSRVEYREGKAIVSKPMPTSSHQDRLGALYLRFNNALTADGKDNFTVYQEHNVFMQNGSDGISRKPDVMVRCFNDAEERRVAGNRQADPEQGVVNPIMMVEVLSKGNSRAEMDEKRHEYLTLLPSLLEYYEVSNSHDCVHVWQRGNTECDFPWEPHVMDEEGIHSFVIERDLTLQEFVDASAAQRKAQHEENERSREAEQQRQEERRKREEADQQRQEKQRKLEEAEQQRQEAEQQWGQERRKREESDQQREKLRKLLRENGIAVDGSGEEV